MDNNMSTAAYMHRPGGSPSTSSAGTGSSTGGNGGGGGHGGPGVRVAVIGVTRNVRLRRRGAFGFGFSLRGGREYAAGFYVSDVQPGGEADRNGLRVGDQIIRVNGYPVEDAVHQEVALLAKNQQVLVLKIRSVGMIPVKDNPNDPVTWHLVQQQQQQQQQQQLQCGETGSGTVPLCTEVRIRIPVGEKGRLGCGVCTGIVPGLTVQGTREGGPARAAGLKAGDVIVWCNGQRLTDLPFEMAIEVMRGAAVLDLVVNRPIPNHLYDTPESLWMRGSSGYDSESSSLLAASPPPPLPSQSSGSPQHQQRGPRVRHTPADEPCNRNNGRSCCPLAASTSSCSSSSEWSHVDQVPEWTRKPNNTTVIRVNHNLNQSANAPSYPRANYGQAPHPGSRVSFQDEPLYDPVAPPRIDYEVHDFDELPRRPYQMDNNVPYDGPIEDNGRQEGNRLAELQLVQRQTETERKTVTTVEVHHSVCPPAPPSMPPPLPYKWQADAKPINAMGMQMGSTMSMGSTGSTETESSLESTCSKDSASTSSSLSTSSCEPASTVSFASVAGTPNCAGKTPERGAPRAPGCPPRNSAAAACDLSSAIAQELQRRALQRSLNGGGVKRVAEPKDRATESRKPQSADALRAQEQKVTHDKLMEEFKRAHRRMFNTAAQQRDQPSDQAQDQQEQERRGTSDGSTTAAPPAPPPLPLAAVVPAKPKPNEDAVEMQSIESFKLKESPSHATVPKPPPTYFPLPINAAAAGSTASTGSATSKSSPTSESPRRALQNGREVASPTTNGQSLLKPVGKVAIRIGAYEGETRPPSRLDFLPPQQQQQQPQQNPRGNEEEVATGPVVSRLQNELAATLQRSNLRKKTDGENAAMKPIPETPDPISTGASTNPESGRPVSLLQSNVEKLASVLNNKVTIKVSPENGSR